MSSTVSPIAHEPHVNGLNHDKQPNGTHNSKKIDSIETKKNSHLSSNDKKIIAIAAIIIGIAALLIGLGAAACIFALAYTGAGTIATASVGTIGGSLSLLFGITVWQKSSIKPVVALPIKKHRVDDSIKSDLKKIEIENDAAAQAHVPQFIKDLHLENGDSYEDFKVELCEKVIPADPLVNSIKRKPARVTRSYSTLKIKNNDSLKDGNSVKGIPLLVLNIASQQAPNIPDMIFKHKEMVVLCACHNALTSISSNISKLENLIDLDLNSNQLTHLPKEIGNLKKLEILRAGFNGFNQLNSIPAELANLKKLRILWLCGNQLTRLPDLSKLTEMTELDISHNQLFELPVWIKEMKKLESLTIAHNSFKVIPDWVAELPKLKHLNVSEDQEVTEWLDRTRVQVEYIDKS